MPCMHRTLEAFSPSGPPAHGGSTLMRIPTILRLIPLLFAAGGLTHLTAQSIAVDKSTMNFSAQSSGAVVSQQLTVTSTAGTEQFSINSSTATNPLWLKVNGQILITGSTPTTVTVTADPTGLNPGNYTATLQVCGVLSSTCRTVNVTFTVSTIGVNPSSVAFTYTQGGAIPPAQSLSLSGSGSYTAAAATTTGGQWLSVNPTSGTLPGGVFATLNASVATGLAVGTYQGSITITPVSSGSPVTVPVTLQVLPTPPVTVNPASLIFNARQGGTNNITTQTLTIATTPGQAMSFSLQGSVTSGTNWITINPSSGTTDPTSGSAQVTVGYSLTGLSVSNTPYTGTISVFTPGGTPTQTNIPVTLNYSSNPLLNVPTNTLNFTYQLGGATPAAKSVNVTSTDSSVTNYSITQSANSPWLIVPGAGNTSAPFSVSVNPAGLTPGTYTATINVTSATPGSTAQQIPVVLKVSNDPMIATNTTAMSFAYQLGQPFGSDRAQTLKITSSTGVPLNYTATPATTHCGSNWLLLNGSANAVSGPTDGTITVFIVTSGLTAGTCTGSINITATNASTGVVVANSPV